MRWVLLLSSFYGWEPMAWGERIAAQVTQLVSNSGFEPGPWGSRVYAFNMWGPGFLCKLEVIIALTSYGCCED